MQTLPMARAKKVLPQRATTWRILRCRDQVLLERRPAPGIWGGLWCFPEGDGKGRRLAPIEHGFTHFRLRIQPLLREVRKKTPARDAERWMQISEAVTSAVPTPVRRLLSSLR